MLQAMCQRIEHSDRATIYIVETDPQVLLRLQTLCDKIDAFVVSCASAEDLLQRSSLATTRACLITELELPGLSGLELLEALKARGDVLPAVILAGNSDIPTAVRAMRAGAVEFFDQPFSDRIVLRCVRRMLLDQSAD